jgi:hypothetical protein
VVWQRDFLLSRRTQGIFVQNGTATRFFVAAQNSENFCVEWYGNEIFVACAELREFQGHRIRGTEKSLFVAVMHTTMFLKTLGMPLCL